MNEKTHGAGDEADELDRELLGETPAGAGEKKEDPNAQGQGAAPAIAPTLAHELAGLFAAIGVGVGKFFPSVKDVLDEGNSAELGNAIAPVLEKYNLARYFAGFAWRVELQAAMTVVPVVLAIRAAIAHDIAEMKKGADPASSAPASAPAASPAPAGALKPIEKT